VSLVEPGEVKTPIWDKGEATADDVERSLDDIGRQRYQWVLDQTRGFLDEGRRKGVPQAKVADAVEHALRESRVPLRSSTVHAICQPAAAFGMGS
jgi:hypothetical protein